MRRMHRAGSPQHHERQVRFDRFVTGDPLDRAVGQVLVEMVGLAVRLGPVIVPHDRNELVHVGRHERVGMVETLAARPAIERADLGNFIQRGVIPLAQGIVNVAVLFEVVGHGLGGLGHDRVVAREPHGGQRMATQSDGVRVAPGHQRGAGGRTKRSRVKIVVPQPVGCQAIDVRCLDQPAKRLTHLGKPDVVQQQDQHVGRTVRWADIFGPPFLGIFVALGDHPAETFHVFRFDRLSRHGCGSNQQAK